MDDGSTLGQQETAPTMTPVEVYWGRIQRALWSIQDALVDTWLTQVHPVLLRFWELLQRLGLLAPPPRLMNAKHPKQDPIRLAAARQRARLSTQVPRRGRRRCVGYPKA